MADNEVRIREIFESDEYHTWYMTKIWSTGTKIFESDEYTRVLKKIFDEPDKPLSELLGS